MNKNKSLGHSKWECKYPMAFTPKCRRRTLYGQLRRYLWEWFRRLAEQKESWREEGRLIPDHVHMLIAVPPKYAVSQVVGISREKCDPQCQGVWRTKAELRGSTFLGTKLFYVDGRQG